MAENITITANILNGNNWEMLCALTGKAGNMDSPEDVEKILGSIYVNGKKQLYVFCRNEIGNLTPYRITPQYEKYKADNTDTTFEQISDRLLSEEEVKDYLQYNKNINDMNVFYMTMSYDFGTNHEGKNCCGLYECSTFSER